MVQTPYLENREGERWQRHRGRSNSCRRGQSCWARLLSVLAESFKKEQVPVMQANSAATMTERVRSGNVVYRIVIPIQARSEVLCAAMTGPGLPGRSRDVPDDAQLRREFRPASPQHRPEQEPGRQDAVVAHETITPSRA